MAMRGYDSQVGARAQNVAVQHSPDEFGAGLGSAVANLGEAVQNARADAELSSGSARLMAAREALLNKKVALRQGAAEDGAGHAEAMAKAWDEQSQQVLDGITDRRVRRQLESQIQGMRASDVESETIWQVGRQTTKTLADAAAVRNQSLSLTARDPAKYGENTKAYHEYINGLTSLDATAKRKELDDYDQSHAVAYLRNVDPQLAVAMLGTSQFDFLTPEARENIRRDSETEIRRAAAEARSRMAAQREDVNQTADGVIKAVKDGVVYKDEDLAVLEQQAKAADLPPAKIYEIQDARALNTVKREFQNASPAVIAESLRETDAAIAKAGADADPKLIQRRNHLETVLGQRRSEIEGDQLGWAAKNGIASPPIDWAAPAPDAVAARIKAVDVAAKAAGAQPQYFTKDEVDQFSGQIGAGKQGALAALDAARAFGGARAVQAAKQLAPNDAVFAYLATLDRGVASIALSGRWHLKTDPRAVNLSKESDNYDDYKAEFAKQDSRVNKAIQSLGAQQVNTIWNTAREILAGYVAQGFGPLTPAMRMRAINGALGANGPDGARRGGLAQWGDALFIRPESMTSADFTRRVQWTVAHGRGGGPVNPDGSPARLAAAVPVFIGPNTYRFDAKDGKPLRKKDGSLFTVWTGK